MGLKPRLDCANSDLISSTKTVAIMQSVKLPVPSSKCQEPVGEPEVCDDVILICSKSAKRIGTKKAKHLTSEGTHHWQWRLMLPDVSYSEIVLEVRFSRKGQRSVSMNGHRVFDTTKWLSKQMSVGAHCFSLSESENHSFELLVDDVPFDELELWPRADRTPKVKTDHGPRTPKVKHVNSKGNVTTRMGKFFMGHNSEQSAFQVSLAPWHRARPGSF